MRRLTALTLALALAAPLAAQAELSANVGVTTDYRYRGISQTALKPALQGGVDATFGGWYVGAWGSTIRWIKDAGGSAPLEVDLYGGYKGELVPGMGYDLGVLSYVYPSNGLRPSANTTELYGGLSWGPVSAKLSRSTGNLFGFANSSGSLYLDLSAALELGDGWTVTPHIGRQRVSNNALSSYTDYSVALAKEWQGVVWSAALIDTNARGYASPTGRDLGRTGLVLGAKKNF